MFAVDAKQTILDSGHKVALGISISKRKQLSFDFQEKKFVSHNLMPCCFKENLNIL